MWLYLFMPKIDTRISDELEAKVIAIAKEKKWSKAQTFRVALEEFTINNKIMKKSLIIAILLIGLMGCKKESEVKPDVIISYTVKIIMEGKTHDYIIRQPNENDTNWRGNYESNQLVKVGHNCSVTVIFTDQSRATIEAYKKDVLVKSVSGVNFIQLSFIAE